MDPSPPRREPLAGEIPPAAEIPPAPAQLAASLRLLVGRLNRRLRQQAIGGLTASQVSALSSADRSGTTNLTALARTEGIAPPSLTRIVARLEELGLVQRTPDPGDLRAARVTVTRRGREALEEIRTERTAFLTQRIEQLDPASREALARALPVLGRLLEDA